MMPPLFGSDGSSGHKWRGKDGFSFFHVDLNGASQSWLLAHVNGTEQLVYVSCDVARAAV